jgi:hypothetical protein
VKPKRRINPSPDFTVVHQPAAVPFEKKELAAFVRGEFSPAVEP